jgi:threonine dehydrogenase-like Zn-dependent dehydrogenase
MEMVQNGKIKLDGLITHRFPLSSYREAFRLVKTKSEDVIKAVFVMD